MLQAGFLRFMSSAALPVAICAPAMFVVVTPCVAQQSAALAAYPVKPIRIIVASSPGTADDFFARSLGEELGAFYRQRVVIENRSGAGGLIGNTLVSRANADGYTLGMVSVTRIITELVREQPPYRALADVVGVAHVASITNVLAVTPSIPARTAPEFVRHARARAGEYAPARASTTMPPSASGRPRISPARYSRARSASTRCTCRSGICRTPSSKWCSGGCITPF